MWPRLRQLQPLTIVVVNSYTRVLSLCSGFGGLDRGVRGALPSARTVCYVEREVSVCAVLEARMSDGSVDEAPVWSDLTTFDGRVWRGVVDLVVAGFPCQPVSVAGRGLGSDDPRWLWPHVLRIVRETEASAVFLENVPGIVGKGLEGILQDIHALGFDAEWGCLDAGAVGATHLRDRWFCLAYSRRRPRWIEQVGISRRNRTSQPQPEGEALADTNSDGCEGEWGCGLLDGERTSPGNDADGCDGTREMGNSNLLGQQQPNNEERTDSRRLDTWLCSSGSGVRFPPLPGDTAAWATWTGPQPAVCRGADGTAGRLHRLRMLGNGVVWQQAKEALEVLCERIVTK